MSNGIAPELHVALERLAGTLAEGAVGLTEAVGSPIVFGPATGDQISAIDLPAGPLLRVQVDFTAGLDGTTGLVFPSELIEVLVADSDNGLTSEELHGDAGLAAVHPLIGALVAACARSLTESQGAPVLAEISESAWCDRLPDSDIDDSHLILEYPVAVAGQPQGTMLVTIDVPLAAGLAVSDGQAVPAAFGAVPAAAGRPPSTPVTHGPADLGALADVQLSVAVELGQAQFTVKEVLALREGSVIRLRRQVGDSVELMVNGTIAARGDVVVVNGKLGLRVREVLDRV